MSSRYGRMAGLITATRPKGVNPKAGKGGNVSTIKNGLWWYDYVGPAGQESTGFWGGFEGGKYFHQGVERDV
jgi:hypothetical protein